MTDEDRRAPPPLAPGLYLVATPIGNLEDITLRALRVLRSADRIACEDTRQTQKLLNHFGISTPTVSHHMHNEASSASELLLQLKSGARIAVVSDAGTPGIADPGALLTAAAIQAGVPVFPVPGASAVISAFCASGIATPGEHAGEFRFRGFLPAKQGQRRTALETIRAASGTSGPVTEIFYEAPHRILETLADLESVFGAAQPVVVARELTKLHEEFLRGPVHTVHAQLAARDSVRGEIVLLFTPHPPETPVAAQTTSIAAQVRETIAHDGVDEKEALKRVARARGIGKSEAYREWQRDRGR